MSNNGTRLHSCENRIFAERSTRIVSSWSWCFGAIWLLQCRNNHCRLRAAPARMRCFAFRHVLSTYVATSVPTEAWRRSSLTRATQIRILFQELPSLQIEPPIDTDKRSWEKPDRPLVSAKVIHHWPARRAEIETSNKRKVSSGVHPSATKTRRSWRECRSRVQSSSFNE